MRHDEVVALLKERLSRTVGSEPVDLGNARGRYLAETVSAPRNVPLHDNSAVDGYAFKHGDHQAAERPHDQGPRCCGRYLCKAAGGWERCTDFYRRGDASGDRYGGHAGRL